MTFYTAFELLLYWTFLSADHSIMRTGVLNMDLVLSK
jgi:hypothetical protein